MKPEKFSPQSRSVSNATIPFFSLILGSYFKIASIELDPHILLVFGSKGARTLNDEKLIAKRIAGDAVALEKYHPACLAALYKHRHARRARVIFL